ncbi:MAG: hypothetical protein EAZ97_07110 [Bacteroidetes bacterium]|nr:MAG: hypothetical protein EAZ97_07110 [Bacteroidota bacterium]
MENVNNTQKKYVFQDILWAANNLFSFCQSLKNNQFEISFEEGVWAFIFFEREKIAYLWQKYPIIFVLKSYSSNIGQIIQKEYPYICLIETNDFYSEKFVSDLEDLSEILTGAKHEKFSLEDF